MHAQAHYGNNTDPEQKLKQLKFIDGKISMSPQITSNDTMKMNKTSRDVYGLPNNMPLSTKPISTFGTLFIALDSRFERKQCEHCVCVCDAFV